MANTIETMIQYSREDTPPCVNKFLARASVFPDVHASIVPLQEFTKHTKEESCKIIERLSDGTVFKYTDFDSKREEYYLHPDGKLLLYKFW